MCGIVGWVDNENELTHQGNILEKMTDSLKHRGPDSSGTWVSKHALIGHRRLTVVDPAGGSQPMIRKRAENEYIITYNGELYNTQELRNELISLGNTFTSNSDTEVLLISFMEWGASCVERLNGIFAFAIWDSKNQSLFLARDRFGVKPLFYTVQHGAFIFASEIKAILANPLIKAEVDIEGLNEIFTMGPSRTPGRGVYKNISEVKPAHCITFNRQGVYVYRYWQLKSRPHVDDFDTTREKTHTLVRDSIIRQLVADVPVCSFLSGGLDSSSITAFAAKDFANTCRGQLHTFSVDYKDNNRFFRNSDFQPDSDDAWIERVSKHFDVCHHDVVFDSDQLAESLEAATLARDLPGMADVDSSLWLFCREVKKNAVVALSGECADEVFGGYPWFSRQELLYSDTFPWIASLEPKLKVLSGDLVNKLNPEQYIKERYAETLADVPVLEGESELESRRRRMFYFNMVWFMSTLLDRKDRMSMAHGLEVRVPFCDHRLVEYIWNVPWHMKMFGGREKGLLREAMKGILPDDVLYRKKSPYPKTHNPAYEKMVKDMLLDVLNSGNSPIVDLVDVKAIRNLVEQDSNYGKPWFGQLMATPQLFAYLLQVDVWLRKYGVEING